VMRLSPAAESDVNQPRQRHGDYAVLEKDSTGRGYSLRELLGPGLEYSFLFFNLNGSSQPFLRPPRFPPGRFPWPSTARPSFDWSTWALRRRSRGLFQRAIRPGSTPNFPRPVRSLRGARELLAADGFTWPPDGTLTDPRGRRWSSPS